MNYKKPPLHSVNTWKVDKTYNPKRSSWGIMDYIIPIIGAIGVLVLVFICNYNR